MKYKMLVLDIDGTLTNSKKEITSATRQALCTIQKHGVRVAIASGRPTPGTRMAANALSLAEFNNFVLSFNGAKITNCGTGEIIFEQILPNNLIPEIYRAAVGYGIGLISYEGEEVIAATPIDPYMELEARINGIAIRRVKDFPNYINFPVNKCLMTGAPEYLAEVERRLQKQFGQSLSIYRSEPYFLELMPPGVDKAKSLEKLLAALSLTREETVCCGDGFNDLSMIEYAGLGVAMKNAQKSVRERADYITATNDEDGIVQVIEKFFGDSL
ncbi:MAG: Cof-type HAD-IIB family hydrolase [Lachnospiraceae bacterium]|nr:Cof-type HAD-IIB family hydrolase [Lachnospiraceae bacterium]